MSRWEPDARGRLERAALELYSERGFEQTTVAEIAARAGLTERTFFRHFADKREVLFGGAGQLQDFLVSTLAATPESVAPIDAVGAAFEAASVLLVRSAAPTPECARPPSPQTWTCWNASWSSWPRCPRRWQARCASAAYTSRPRA